MNHTGKMWNLNEPKDLNAITNYKNTSFDVWVYHLLFSSKIFDIIIPSQRIITIARHPSNRFLSAWHWYNLSQQISLNSVKQFLESNVMLRQMYGPWGSSLINLFNNFKLKAGLNSISQELSGVQSHNIFMFRCAFETLLENIMKGKYLVLIADQFNESLIVLSKILDLKLYQLLHFKYKVNNYKKESHKTWTSLRDLQDFDMALFNLAGRILNELIDFFDPSRQQVNQLRNGVQNLISHCCFHNDTTCYYLRMDNREFFRNFHQSKTQANVAIIRKKFKLLINYMAL
jgi:hypothetical protein